MAMYNAPINEEEDYMPGFGFFVIGVADTQPNDGGSRLHDVTGWQAFDDKPYCDMLLHYLNPAPLVSFFPVETDGKHLLIVQVNKHATQGLSSVRKLLQVGTISYPQHTVLYRYGSVTRLMQTQTDFDRLAHRMRLGIWNLSPACHDSTRTQLLRKTNALTRSSFCSERGEWVCNPNTWLTFVRCCRLLRSCQSRISRKVNRYQRCLASNQLWCTTSTRGVKIKLLLSAIQRLRRRSPNSRVVPPCSFAAIRADKWRITLRTTACASWDFRHHPFTYRSPVFF